MYESPRTGEVSELPVGVDPGFANNPGKAGIEYAAEQALKEKLAGADEDIAKAMEKIEEPVLPPSFRVRGRASAQFRQAVQDAYEEIPKRLREQVEAAGHTVVLGRTVAEIEPSLKGEHPRGWDPGATFDEVPAVFMPQHKMIAVGEYTRQGTQLLAESPEESAMVLRHEFGHSLDAALRRPSDGPEFVRAYEADVAAITAADHPELGYFLQMGEAGRHEVFAQLIAEALGGANMSISGFFPRCWDIVKSLTKE